MKISIKWSLLLVLGLVSCDSWLERFPLDKPSVDTFYKNETEFQGALNACYEFLNEVKNNYYSSVYAMDAFTETVMARDGFPILLGTHDFRDATSTDAWNRLYQGVARCNLFLSKLEEMKTSFSEEKVKQWKGEACFLRAYYYLRLTQHFGDVIYTEAPITSIQEAVNVKRTPQAEVYKEIQEDFDTAISCLEGSEVKNLGRATWGAAMAYKARAALYQKEWNTVVEVAGKLIADGSYDLYPSYEKLFTEEGVRDPNNKEQIFVVDHDLLANKTTGFITYAGSRAMGGWATIAPTQNLIDSYQCLDGKDIDTSDMFDKAHPYENRDPRLKFTCVVPGEWWYGMGGTTMQKFDTHADSLTTVNELGETIENKDCYSINAYTSYTGYVFKKYINPQYFSNMGKDETPFMLCRFAEVLLTYAEAKTELNEIDADCLNAINRVRNQRDDVKMPSIPAGLSQPEMRKAIYLERKIELANENLRLQDLRRWKRMEVLLNRPLMGRPVKGDYVDYPRVTFDEYGDPVYDYNSYKPHPSTDYRIVTMPSFNPERDYLWGIPEKDVTLNPGLGQNPNY